MHPTASAVPSASEPDRAAMSDQGAGWVLEIDGAKCDGHGICVLRCPELVSLDEWGFATVSSAAIDDRATARRAKLAVAACPEQALRLEPQGRGRHAAPPASCCAP